jgi:hypothetical protein
MKPAVYRDQQKTAESQVGLILLRPPRSCRWDFLVIAKHRMSIGIRHDAQQAELAQVVTSGSREAYKYTICHSGCISGPQITNLPLRSLLIQSSPSIFILDLGRRASEEALIGQYLKN